jgi:hypothetical protein
MRLKGISRLIAVTCCFLFIVASSFAEEKYDPQHTMLALNMAIVSVHKIISSKDKALLTNEYDNIIDNLAIGNIESDYEIQALYEELLDIISNKRIREEEAQRLQKKYKKKEQRKLYDSLKGVRAYGGDLYSWIGSLFVSCATQYFEYQNSGEELKDELEDNLWILTKEDLESCNSIQKRLLTSSWSLLRKYHLPDSYRLEQDSLKEFYNILTNKDAHQRLRILKRIEKDFIVYPPYWIYRAKTAQEIKDKDEARKCYDKFDEVWRPVLRKDPFKQEAVKYRISELTNKLETNKTKIKEYLEVLENHSKRGEWLNNIFAGIVYYAINEKEKAIDSVQSNLDSKYETEISKELYEAFKSGNVDIKSLGEKIGLTINNVTRKAVSQGAYFGGVKFGSTKEEVKAFEKNSTLVLDNGDELIFNETSSIGKSQNIYSFDKDGKMVVGTYIIINDHKDLANYIADYIKVNEALKQLYGEPTQEALSTDDKNLINNPAKLAQAIKEGKVAGSTEWKKGNYTIYHILSEKMTTDDMDEKTKKVTVITPVCHLILGQLN